MFSTGYNISYKEDGFYPEVTDDIKNIPDIDIINKINDENTFYNMYFAFAIDRNGDEILQKCCNLN